MNRFKKCFRWVKVIINDRQLKKICVDNYKHHKKYNVNSSMSCEKVGYNIMLNAHALEKGMTNPHPRRFGKSKVETIGVQMKLYKKNNWPKDFAYNNGVSVLGDYCKFYNKQDWSDSEECRLAKQLIDGENTSIKAGTTVVKKQQKSFDYDGFVSSRHSVRDFDDKKISSVDMKKAVEIAIKTPTACNRQMVKVYYVKNDAVKNKIIKYSHGLTGFNLDNTNLVLLTYDTSSLMKMEFGQGLFNAGLFAMNLVNAMHSLGIGSCMLEYSVSMKEENEEKKILGIPDCERIAVVIGAGYYKDETIVPKSVRKPLEEIYRER